jgi:hypothetical protein
VIVIADTGLDPYAAAIIGAAAAVIGGLIAAGSNLVVEGRRRRGEREAQAAKDARELRQATRVVLTEVAEINQAIRTTATSLTTWENERGLPAYAWREYRAILAAYLPVDAWRRVEQAYNSANALNWQAIEMNREFGSDGPIAFVDNEWLRGPFEVTHDAMEALERALGEAVGAFGYTGYASVEELGEGIWATRSEPEGLLDNGDDAPHPEQG